jgi:hypothetical protein
MAFPPVVPGMPAAAVFEQGIDRERRACYRNFKISASVSSTRTTGNAAE